MPWTWSAEQLEPGRIKRALGADLTPLHVADDSASFAGSSGSVYTAGLQSCTCRDFAITRHPCKHMIRLAMILGYVSGEGITVDQSAAEDKLALAVLEQRVKTAPIAQAMRLVYSIQRVFSGDALPMSDYPCLDGNPLILVDDKGLMHPADRYTKTLEMLISQLSSRIGEMAAGYLGYQPLVRVLSSLEADDLTLDELSALLKQ